MGAIIFHFRESKGFCMTKNYYLIHQEIIGSNAGVNIGKWSSGDWYYYVSWLSTLGAESYLLNPSGAVLDNAVSNITNISPTTTTGSTDFTTGQSFSLSGAVGFNGTNPTGNISEGVTWSESWKTSIPDLAIINKSLSNGNNAYWDYTIAWPHVESDYLNTDHRRMSIDNIATIGSNTIIIHNTWIWTVDDPKNFTGKFKVKSSVIPCFGYIRAKQSWIGDQSWNGANSGYYYTNTFDLTPPNRQK
jgi:hypothetical protein